MMRSTLSSRALLVVSAMRSSFARPSIRQFLATTMFSVMTGSKTEAFGRFWSPDDVPDTGRAWKARTFGIDLSAQMRRTIDRQLSVLDVHEQRSAGSRAWVHPSDPVPGYIASQSEVCHLRHQRMRRSSVGPLDGPWRVRWLTSKRSGVAWRLAHRWNDLEGLCTARHNEAANEPGGRRSQRRGRRPAVRRQQLPGDPDGSAFRRPRRPDPT